jgi:hypothetical protein
MAETTEVLNHGNMAEMRAILWSSIEGIRSGKSSPAQVNAISNACGKFLGTIKLEIEYHKLTGKTPNIPALAAGVEESK